MADERLLAPIRRFWNKETVLEAYRKIFEAVQGHFDNPVTITGKSSGEDSANGEITVRPEQFLAYLEVLEARMLEYDAAEAGEEVTQKGNSHADFSYRHVRT
jgi:hypothetical protein